MTEDEYKMIQDLLIAQGRIFAMLDIEKFLELADRSDAIGPLFHPTLWLDAHDKMDIIRTIARGALAFKQAVIKAEGMREKLFARETSVP